MNDRLEEAKSIVSKINEDANLRKVVDMLKDNKIEFTHNEHFYRVRLLTVGEKEELDLLRKNKFGELLNNKNILFAKEIIKKYKEERGIDIEKDIDEEIEKFNAQEFDLQVQLGEAINKKENEAVLKAYEEKIYSIREKRQILGTQKLLLIENCFENILEDFVYRSLVYLSLETKIEDTWEKVYKKLEDLQNETDAELVMRAGEYAAILQTR